jgi:hypothetical protein
MKSEGFALLLVLALCAVTWPATIYVDDNAPGDLGPSDPNISDPQEGSAGHPFDSIQEAIDISRDGDTIIVAPGHYLSPDTWAYAELQFRGKSIRLVSSKPTDFTVADQTILCGVVIFDGTEDPNCLLQGFKIQNHGYGGILGNKTQASISHCILSGNGPCGATVLKDVYGRISNCLIVDNTTFHDCGVLPVVSGCHVLVNCTIANNLSGIQIRSDSPSPGTLTILHNCIVYGNQGPSQLIAQLTVPSNRGSTGSQVDYSLIGDWGTTSTARTNVSSQETVFSGDPCFVRLGYWQDAPAPPAGRDSVPLQARKKVLVEGDYHLQSAGWRWSAQSVHGSNWYFDPSTSPALDAGDPMDSLGEELERAPDDPEGQWGVNHAINLGAYGGTAQASLAPTEDEPPGVGAVDLRDYWPLTAGDFNQWLVHNPAGTARGLSLTGQLVRSEGAVGTLTTRNAPDWVTRLYCLYVGRALYLTPDIRALHLPVEVPQQVQARYPRFLGVGATVEVPYDPFAQAAVQYQTVFVARGALAEVLAGTSVDRNQLLPGTWPDVIALRQKNADGAAGDPIAIFARGFGPLLIAGQPIEQAGVDGKIFGTAGTSTPPAARPATRG